MDYSFFFNHLSLPASGEKQAYELLNEAFQGVLHLKQNEDRIFLYFDGETIYDCELSEGFTYNDYKTILSYKDRDLLELINDIEDKAPVLDYLSPERIDEMAQISPYFENHPYNENIDIFAMAWIENGIMLSLATKEFWKNHNITFFSLVESQYQPNKYKVYNISHKEHAKFILDATEQKIQDICPDAIFTGNFKTWYKGCKKEDKLKIKNKLQHCYENNFKSGNRDIDTIKHSNFTNMKEILIGDPHGQKGKIRILFVMNDNRKSVILYGFIKHSNDYTEPIRIADNILKEYYKSKKK